jgi:hypothetical protein
LISPTRARSSAICSPRACQSAHCRAALRCIRNRARAPTGPNAEGQKKHSLCLGSRCPSGMAHARGVRPSRLYRACAHACQRGEPRSSPAAAQQPFSQDDSTIYSPTIASRTRALDPVLRIRHLFTLKPTWTLPELSPYLQYAPASLPALRNALHAKLIGANCRKDPPPAPTMLLPFSDH